MSNILYSYQVDKMPSKAALELYIIKQAYALQPILHHTTVKLLTDSTQYYYWVKYGTLAINRKLRYVPASRPVNMMTIDNTVDLISRQSNSLAEIQ